MTVVSVTIYFVTLLLCLSTYAIYPLLIWVLGFLIPYKVEKGPYTPFVSIIIPAFNEAKDIAGKITNTLDLNYPGERMEILLGCDGCTDETAEIGRKFLNRAVKVLEFKENRGKTAVQNDLVNLSKGDILVFTDAASLLERYALGNLLRNFADDRVGCVAGRMLFRNTDSNLTTQSQGLYWRYESKIRELESKLGRLIGVDGPLYAVRRDDYVHLKSHIISDLISPLLILNSGKRVVLESEAVVYEDPTYKSAHEFRTRRRITVRGLVSLREHLELVNVFNKSTLAAQILFHKVLRWSIGFLVLLNMITCGLLSGIKPFDSILVLYVLFMAIASVGCIQAHLKMKNRIFSIPYYFTLVNSAAAMGIIDFFRKKQATVWKPTRHI